MKRLTPLFFVLAFYNGRGDRKIYTHTETQDVPFTSDKNFVNFSAVDYRDVVASLPKVDGCTFALFPPESID